MGYIAAFSIFVVVGLTISVCYKLLGLNAEKINNYFQ
jgi:hypothetical protein